MGYAAGYSLDLYCDNADADPNTPRNILAGTGRPRPNDGVHGWAEFPHTYTGETFGECAREARDRGWLINARTRKALCPKCSGKSGVVSTAALPQEPSHD